MFEDFIFRCTFLLLIKDMYISEYLQDSFENVERKVFLLNILVLSRTLPLCNRFVDG